MTKTNSMKRIPAVADQSGMAFALALFAMLMLTLIGYGLAVSSRGAVRVGTGFKSQKAGLPGSRRGSRVRPRTAP